MNEASGALLQITLLLAAQRRRWERGDCVEVEAYCREEPALRNAPEALLDLICGEIVLREEFGRRPCLEDYLRRFPKLADELRVQFDVHRAIRSGTFGRVQGTDPPTAAPAVTGAVAVSWTTPGLLDWLRACRLLEPAQVALLGPDIAAGQADPRSLARELLRRGWLTAYQLNQVFLGRGRELLLGPYIFLERLGEGGMGQVFKAQHGKMGRVVAVKVIHPKHMAKADAVRRFQREVLAAAKLDHPNIVRAYDAGEANGRHYLVMEHVVGKSLAHVVKEQGTVQPLRACDWVRQAALGLQHAYRRGLVHRDIKPANLLLANDGTVKILDLGLARLKETDTGEATSPLTGEGLLVGTPDFLAPEQAEEAHAADIRADIYSLGCTLYYLLSGRPPFAGGSLGQKLRRHLVENPAPIETLRPDTPPEVRLVLQKMMAKLPADRYQTPADVAQALAALAAPAQSAEPVRTDAPNAASQWEDLWSDETVVDQPAPATVPRSPKRHRRLFIAGGVCLLLGLAALVPALIFRRPAEPSAGDPTPPIDKVQQTAETADFYRWLKDTKALPPEKQMDAVAAKLKELNPGFDGAFQNGMTDGNVGMVHLDTNAVADLSPLRAFTKLHTLTYRPSTQGKGKLTSLKPLEGLELRYLDINGQTDVRDLTPVKDMPLGYLRIGFTSIADLTPLRGKPLKNLKILDMHNCWVTDISPLRGMKLEYLAFGGWGTPVSDLSPLADMPLTTLECPHSPVENLAPLKGLTLQRLTLHNTRVKDLSPLAGMKTLTSLHIGDTAVDDLAPLRGLSLTQLVMSGTQVRELTPLEGMPLTSLDFDRTVVDDPSVLQKMPLKILRLDSSKVRSLDALRGLQLEYLYFANTQVSDLSPLQGMPLKALYFGNCPVSDLTPVIGMPLWELDCANSAVTDLKPLENLPLTALIIAGTKVRDLSPLRNLPLESLQVNFSPGRDAVDLRPIWTLQKINEKSVAEFWEDMGWPELLRADLKRLMARSNDPAADRERLREDVDAFRRRHPGTPEAVQAAALQARLPSPLDKLDPDKIPTQERFGDQPKDLVAILGEFRGRHGAEVQCVAYSPDGKSVVSGGDNYVRVYDPGTLRPKDALPNPSQVTRLVFSPDSRILAVAGRAGTVRFWDMTGEKPKERFTFQVTTAQLWGLAFSPDGERLATASEDGLARLWDVAKDVPKQAIAELTGHKRGAKTVAYSPDGRLLAVGDHEKLVHLWDISAGKEPVERSVLEGSSGSLLTIAFSPDGRSLIAGSAGDTLCLWSLEGAKARRRPTHQIKVSPVYSLSFVPKTGRILAAGCLDGIIRLLDPATLQERHRLIGHEGPWASVAFATDGNTLISGSYDWTVRFWDLADGKPRERKLPWGHLPGAWFLAFSPDGKTLASAGGSERAVRLWDLTGAVPREAGVIRDPGWVTNLGRVAFVLGGRGLVLSDSGNALELWDVKTRKRVHQYRGHKGSIYFSAPSPDGRTFLTGGDDKIMRLWQVDPPKEIRRFEGHQATINCVASSPDGKRALSGSGVWLYDKDGKHVVKDGRLQAVDSTVRLWDTGTGKELLKMAGGPGLVGPVAFLPDGNRALSSGYQAEIRLWNLDGDKAGQQAQPQAAGSGMLIGIAPDGRTFLTAQESGHLVEWDVVTLKPLRTWNIGEAFGGALSPDGRYAALCLRRGPIYILRIK